MGNNACNGICEKSNTLEPIDDQFLPTQTLIPCQICNVHLDETRFKQHIDHDHFCSIVENHEGLVNAQCLLCEHLSANLEEQAAHIAEKHSYAKCTKKPTDQKSNITSAIDAEKQSKQIFLSYRAKKARIRKLNSQKEFQILNRKEEDHIEVSLKGEKYRGEIKIKQYRGAEFDQPLVQGELIWYRLFLSQTQHEYYFFDVEPKQRTIVCKAYLFSSLK